MIETEIDSKNAEAVMIAQKFINCGDPIKCASEWVSSNIGYAPNALTSIVNAMGEMGKPYIAFSADIGGKVGNEVWDYDKDVEYHIDLESAQLKKKAYGYMDPIQTSEQPLLKRLFPVFASVLIGACTGYAFGKR